jgi:hypothetical protein
MSLITKREDTAGSLRADANKQTYLLNAEHITSKVEDRKAVVEARRAALEAEHADLNTIQV